MNSQFIQRTTDPYEQVENRILIENITDSIKGYLLDNVIFKNDRDFQSVYTQVILEIIKRLKLTRDEQSRIRGENKGKNGAKRMENKLYDIIEDDERVLYTDVYYTYNIPILTREVLASIVSDLHYATNYHITNDDFVAALLEGGLTVDGKDNRQDTNNKQR